MLGDQLVQQPRGRRIKSAIGILLNLLGEASAQQVGPEGFGWIGFELRAPERAKPRNRHQSKLIKLGLDHGVQIRRHHAARLRLDGSLFFAWLPSVMR